MRSSVISDFTTILRKSSNAFSQSPRFSKPRIAVTKYRWGNPMVPASLEDTFNKSEWKKMTPDSQNIKEPDFPTLPKAGLKASRSASLRPASHENGASPPPPSDDVLPIMQFASQKARTEEAFKSANVASSIDQFIFTLSLITIELRRNVPLGLVVECPLQIHHPASRTFYHRNS